MQTHVSDAELMDVLDGGASAEAKEHLVSCPACRSRLEAARDGMAWAREADVPEPSPLYWQAFPGQVDRRLARERRRFRLALWPGLAALAAGLAFIALPRVDPKVAVPAAAAPLLPAWSALPASDTLGLGLVQAVVVDLGPEAECAGIDECVADLSDAEGGALAELLRPKLVRKRL
jgi:predicted anti-sigma-YlaC factor YlaD